MLFICDTTVHDFYLDLEGFDQIACISQVILIISTFLKGISNF